VADNRFIGIDIDRAEGIAVTNTTVIGQSRSYTELMSKQDDIPILCSRDRLYGIDLHTWKLAPDHDKVTIEDVTFVGYDNTGCIKSHPIHLDDDVRFSYQLRQYYFHWFEDYFILTIFFRFSFLLCSK
jgi:hypothetical protein